MIWNRYFIIIYLLIWVIDDFVHFYIVVFGGDGICHLEGEGQANEGASEVGE